jgi:hypothetical protein
MLKSLAMVLIEPDDSTSHSIPYFLIPRFMLCSHLHLYHPIGFFHEGFLTKNLLSHLCYKQCLTDFPLFVMKSVKKNAIQLFIMLLMLSVGSKYSHQHSYPAFVVYNDRPHFPSIQVYITICIYYYL